jgi:tetratricopeptide (TPR) repeat protein
VGASLTAWQLEWAFLDMLSAHDEDRPYAKQWLVATSAALQRDYRLGEALPNLEHAQHLFPDDFTVLLYLGAVHETLAGSKAQSALIATPLPIGASFAYRPEREELQSAKGLLRKAVAAQPKSAVAHLRFGHVLGALGEFPLAMDELGRARQLAPPSDPEFDFDAAMLLGNGALGLGQLSAAEAEFQKASGLYPQATSARLALSYTAQQAGDVTDATTPLIRLLSTGRKDVADPWPGYWILHVRDATEALTRLRHRVSSERF